MWTGSPLQGQLRALPTSPLLHVPIFSFASNLYNMLGFYLCFVWFSFPFYAAEEGKQQLGQVYVNFCMVGHERAMELNRNPKNLPQLFAGNWCLQREPENKILLETGGDDFSLLEVRGQKWESSSYKSRHRWNVNPATVTSGCKWL